MMMTNAMNFPKISRRKVSEDFSRSVPRLRRSARMSLSSLRSKSESDTKGMFCRLKVMFGKSETKFRKVGTKESERRTTRPVRSAMKAMTMSPAARHSFALQEIDGGLQEELQEEREKDDEGEIGKEPESGEQEREGDCQDDGCAVVCKMHRVNSFFLESGRDEKAPL